MIPTAPRRLLVLALAAAALGAPLPALARDICLHDTSNNDWSFQKVKKLKPGRVVALAGIFIEGGESYPVSGSAVLRANGSVEVGAFVHSMSQAIFAGNNFTVSMQTTTGLEGTGGFDTDGDFENDAAVTYGWAAIDCKSLSIP
jgi:hypothetical protein